MDKQYTYYIMKLLESIVYPARRRVSLMNKVINHRALIEDASLSELYPKLQLDTFEFWEVFYRHNNYFLERNTPMLNKVKNNKNFEQANYMNDHSIGFENFIEFYDVATNSLSSIGIRVCSLIDIIKIMKAVALPLRLINQTVKSLAERFKVEQEIIDRVFKASEDNISLLVHKSEERTLLERKDVFKRLFEYLPSKDGLELVLVNKDHFESLKEAWIGTKLRFCDNLIKDHPVRMQMWYCLVFPVVKY